ncbi:hypothetical protein GQ457_10G002020 [Hibiscus cannabinus]
MEGQGKSSSSPSYLKITPGKAGVKDLSRLLRGTDLRDRDFVQSSDETDLEFKYRLLIFISTLVQKLLIFFSTPLAVAGRIIETSLNFLSNNPNLRALITNLIAGTLIPPRDSANFVSFIGQLDKRRKWDSDIKQGDGLWYYSALCMMASKAAYENPAYIQSIVNDWEMVEFLGFYNCWNDYQKKAMTGTFLLRVKGDDHDTVVVAFRGTEPFNADNWCTDWDLSQKQLGDAGSVHDGFMKALGLPEDCQDDPNFFNWPVEYKENRTGEYPLAYYFIRDKLKTLLTESDKTRFIVTGHSLGGALAILLPTILLYHDENFLLQRLEGVYTFGQPRVGDGKFAQFMENKLKEHDIRHLRFVYDFDMVPRLPFDDKDHWYKHFGKCLYYDCHYNGKVVTVLPNKNYFSLVFAGVTMMGAMYVLVESFMVSMDMIMSAMYELVRSFTIQYTEGPYYKEGWLSRATRIPGLVMPGVSDHSPLGYVSCTCLESPEDLLESSTVK